MSVAPATRNTRVAVPRLSMRTRRPEEPSQVETGRSKGTFSWPRIAKPSHAPILLLLRADWTCVGLSLLSTESSRAPASLPWDPIGRPPEEKGQLLGQMAGRTDPLSLRLLGAYLRNCPVGPPLPPPVDPIPHSPPRSSQKGQLRPKPRSGPDRIAANSRMGRTTPR